MTRTFPRDTTLTPPNALDTLRIASPCHASWADMRGDDRVRFCETCARNVYDLSALTSADALTLIEQTEGRLCVRFYRRSDGTVLTADCPVGLRYAVRRRLLRLATAGVVVLAALRSGIWLYATGQDRPAPTGPGASISDWFEWAAQSLGLQQPGGGQGQRVMGSPCTFPSSPPAPVAPGATAPVPGPSGDGS